MKALKFLAIGLLTAIILSCSTANNKTLLVAADTRTCQGVAEMDCLLVKTDKNQAEWQNFYSNIEGFTYEKGFEYELLVKETPIEYPPADASSIRYTLVKVVSKTAE